MSKETRYPNYTTFSYYILYNLCKAIKVTVKIFRQSPTIKIAVKTFNHLRKHKKISHYLIGAKEDIEMK